MIYLRYYWLIALILPGIQFMNPSLAAADLRLCAGVWQEDACPANLEDRKIPSSLRGQKIDQGDSGDQKQKREIISLFRAQIARYGAKEYVPSVAVDEALRLCESESVSLDKCRKKAIASEILLIRAYEKRRKDQHLQDKLRIQRDRLLERSRKSQVIKPNRTPRDQNHSERRKTRTSRK